MRNVVFQIFFTHPLKANPCVEALEMCFGADTYIFIGDVFSHVNYCLCHMCISQLQMTTLRMCHHPAYGSVGVRYTRWEKPCICNQLVVQIAHKMLTLQILVITLRIETLLFQHEHIDTKLKDLIELKVGKFFEFLNFPDNIHVFKPD